MPDWDHHKNYGYGHLNVRVPVIQAPEVPITIEITVTALTATSVQPFSINVSSDPPGPRTRFERLTED